MTNEQQKAKELAELLNAFAEGKQLEYYNDIDEVWCRYNITFLCSFMDAFANNKRKYRIKPETKRIALTQQDLIDRVKENKTMWLSIDEFILRFTNTYMYTSNGGIPYLFACQHHYTFLDGTPCYKEVEDVA